MMRVPAVLLLTSVGVVPAFAECNGSNFADSGTYGTAIARKKTYFMDEAGTSTGSYVLKGDEVVVVSVAGDKTCAEYASVKAGASGWIATADLGPTKKQEFKTVDWNGKFVRDELGSNIRLVPKGGNKIEVSGEAFWANSLEAARQGGVNDAGMGDTTAITNGVLHVGPADPKADACVVDVRLLSRRYVIAQDNISEHGISQCGGANTSFTGLYVKVKK